MGLSLILCNIRKTCLSLKTPHHANFLKKKKKAAWNSKKEYYMHNEGHFLQICRSFNRDYNRVVRFKTHFVVGSAVTVGDVAANHLF